MNRSGQMRGFWVRSVSERTRQFGIRMALGSSLGAVILDAVAPGVWLSVTGVAIGGMLTAAGVSVLKGLLWGVQPMDPATFLLTGAALIAVSVVASLLRRWR